MTSVIEETIENISVMLDDVNDKHQQIKNRIESSNTTRNSMLSMGTEKIKDFEKCVAKIEERKRRNSTTLKSFLSIMKSISDKVDTLAMQIHIPEDTICIEKQENDNKPSYDRRKEITKENETIEKRENTQIHSLETRMVTKSLKLGNDIKKPSPKPTSPPKKSVNNSQRRILKLQIDTSLLPPIKRSVDGFKRRTTHDNYDNRGCFFKKAECFQGNVVDSALQTPDNQTLEDPPNIVVVEPSGSSSKDNIPGARMSSRMMTMADISERDFEGKKQVRSLMEWHQVFLMNELQVAFGGLVNPLTQSRGRGHYYMLLLDVSDSMRGEKFSTMLKITKSYLDGLQQVFSRVGIQDNVGLACFGDETKLILKPTIDYNQIRTAIDKLKPSGPSPLAAGLLMALSGVSHSSSTISNHDFQARIIVVTDGLPTRVEAPNEEDRDVSKELAVSFLLGNKDRDDEINKVVSDISNRGIRVFCVPLGIVTTDVLKRVAENTCGKIIPPDEIHRMCRHTEILHNSSEIAHQLQFSADVDRNMVKSTILAADSELQILNTYDDVTDNVMLLLDPRSQYPGKFRNPINPSIRLGTRVRRGPNWHWKNQDSNMAGTVIGEDNDGGMIWVEWDSGNKNCYTYDDRRHLYDIKPVNEPRRLIDEIIAVGCKVKRGKDWKFGDQDGGRGSRGSVLRVESNGKVVVYWDRGRLGVYMFGSDDIHEVAVCEHGRTIGSEDEDCEIEEKDKDTSELPLIIPSHSRKKKPVAFSWKFQDKDESWISYDDETNAKIDHAYSRNPEGKCIIEIDKTIFLIMFTKMIQENQTDKTTTPVRRIAKLGK